MNIEDISIKQTKNLVDNIILREERIHELKIELVEKWIAQGVDLISLQIAKGCSQNNLSKLTGISKGSISIYINIAKDDRISQIIC